MLIVLSVFSLSRKLSLKPNTKQNALEYVVDFTNTIVKEQSNKQLVNYFGLFAFVLFLFIFFSNQIGLFINLPSENGDLIKSPSSDAMVAMTLALMVFAVAHFFAMASLGIKKYFSSNYLLPFKSFLPVNILEQLANFLTLGLRLYGNIFAGEVLLKLIANIALPNGKLPDSAGGIGALVASVPLEIVWQAFSVFVGAIQAFIFVTLSMVYVAQLIEDES